MLPRTDRQTLPSAPLGEACRALVMERIMLSLSRVRETLRKELKKAGHTDNHVERLCQSLCQSRTRYTNTRWKTSWRDDIRTFAGTGWSTLTPAKEAEMKSEHLPKQGEVH